MATDVIEKARQHFADLIERQLNRVEKMKHEQDWIDYGKLKPIIIGILGGDGIGPYIAEEARRILEFLL